MTNKKEAPQQTLTSAQGDKETSDNNYSTKDAVGKFQQLFPSFTQGHGCTVPKGRKGEAGKKLEARSWTEKKPISADDWLNHLKGSQKGLGLVPLLDNGRSVQWAAIDIDDYETNTQQIEAKTRELNLPLVVCRSKSGGSHCYLFLTAPIPATDVVAALTNWADALGHSGCEIFPKQTNRANPDDVGNWINLPYFGGDASSRYALRNGEAISIIDFIDYAESMRVGPEALTKRIASAAGTLFEDSPPCLAALASAGGFDEGSRNEGMFNVAVYLRDRYGDDLEAHIEKYNEAMCHPPLAPQELRSITKSTSKKEYGYKCSQPPIAQHCDRQNCVMGGRGLIGYLDEAELWHSPDGDCFASIERDGHTENLQIGHKQFERWLIWRYFSDHGTSPGSDRLKRTVQTADARARFSGDEHKAWLRVGEAEGNLYLDLGDDDWTTIEITADGWRKCPNPPVRFRRGGGKSLPMPLQDGKIDELRPFVNVKDDDDFMLLVGFLVACFRPEKPFPILDLAGEKGTAKTTTLKLIRRLVDPVKAEGRGLPSKEDDLVVSAQNNWLLSGDNISRIKPEMADALCRLATGGGLAKRQHYTDGEEYSIEAMRPVALTGINTVTERQDLLDRMLVVTLKPIEEVERRDEHSFWEKFETSQAMILGALLDGVSMAIRRRDKVKLERLPRMADFILFVESAAQAFGWKPGEFMAAHARMSEGVFRVAVEGDAVAATIVEWLNESGGFSGPAAKLLTSLNDFRQRHSHEEHIRHAWWPRDATRMAKALRRVAGGLRSIGIGYEEKDDRSRKVTIYELRPPNSQEELDLKK